MLVDMEVHNAHELCEGGGTALGMQDKRSLGKRDQRDPKIQEGRGHLALTVLGVLVALLLLLQLLGHGLGELRIAPFLRLKRGLEAVCCDPEEGVGLEVVELVEEDVEPENQRMSA